MLDFPNLPTNLEELVNFLHHPRHLCLVLLFHLPSQDFECSDHLTEYFVGSHLQLDFDVIGDELLGGVDRGLLEGDEFAEIFVEFQMG